MIAVGCWLQLLSTHAGQEPSPTEKPTPGEESIGITAMVDKDVSQRVKKLKRAITKLRAIKGASALIIGDTALIGIRLSGQVHDDTVLKIQREIQMEIGRTDNTIKDITVTSDDRLVQAIETLEQEVLSGTPIDLLARDITEVLRCIDY